jgi:hypothetical protein
MKNMTLDMLLRFFGTAAKREGEELMKKPNASDIID